jgi:hypothetical protein
MHPISFNTHSFLAVRKYFDEHLTHMYRPFDWSYSVHCGSFLTHFVPYGLYPYEHLVHPSELYAEHPSKMQVPSS